jgi:hypothetical protein
MKKTLGILLALALVAAGIGGYLYSSLDSLAQQAIEKIGSRVLQVPVRVAAVKLSPADGAGSLTGLAVGNPAGFHASQALQAERIELAVDPKSLTADVLHIRSIAARGVTVSYETTAGGNNFDALRRNVEQQTGSSPRSAEPARKLIVDSLVLGNIHMSYTGAATLGKAVELRLPDISLENVGARQGGVTPDHLAKAVLDALIRGMASAAATATRDAAKSIGDNVKGLFSR